ncbi:MAG: acyl-CoA dehydrogenase family protein [Fimbriimonadaceae bacterium]
MSSAASRPLGGAFLSHTPDQTFIPEDFAGDDKLMIEAAEQFSRREITPISERLDHQEEGLMPGLIRKAGELGFVGVDSPAEFGGLGLGKNLAARILEYLSLNASFSVTLGVTSGIGQIGLSLFGNEEQKSKYLPRITSGEWIAAYCLSEPNSGSDALSIGTRADFKNGKCILNGTKMWISNAKWAQFFLVMAKIDGEKFSAFLVERGFPGVHISREEHKMGLKGSSTARVVLEDAEVPEENLLYEPGLGHHVAFNALNLGRFKLSSMSLGPARDAIGLAAEYADDRKQFGRPISEFGLIRQKFAEMAARYFAAEAMIYRTGALIDAAFSANHLFQVSEGARGADVIAFNRKAAEEYAVECSICKVFATETQAFIVDEALQVYGGYGFTEEFPIARHYRDARVSRIYEGTNEINRLFIADRMLKRSTGQALADGFISELAVKAMAIQPDDQIRVGALSDLLMLTYAEQSARLRANRIGGHADALYRIFLNWANGEAARRYQLMASREVTIPAPINLGVGDIAAAVIESRGPL